MLVNIFQRYDFTILCLAIEAERMNVTEIEYKIQSIYFFLEDNYK